MRRARRHTILAALAASLLLLPACGDSEGGTPDSGGGGDAAPRSDGAADDTGIGPDAAHADGAGDGGGNCMVWEITYDLTGSVFEISDTPLGAGDQVNTVATPYDAGDHVGPGTMTLRFQNVGGSPGGVAAIAEYAMGMHFVVDSGLTVVTTDVDASAGPAECGVTTGALSGDTVAWSPAALVGHRSVGQILCEGSLCSMGGLPNGTPEPVDDTGDQPLGDFVFTADLASFSMARTVIAQDANSTTSWEYQGTEIDRELVPAPACLCP